MWTNWKNNQGAKRSDGLYLRSSWGWHRRDTKPFTYLKGWDLLKGQTLLGTIAKYPLEEAKAKIDEILPIGVKARPWYPEGRFHPLEPWMYSIYECQSCEKDSYLPGTHWGFNIISCPLCKHETSHAVTWTARELEPQTHWVFANIIERDVNEYLQYLNERNATKDYD